MFLPKPDPAQQKAARSYVRAKARLLQKKGVKRYRSENRLQDTPSELEPAAQSVLLRACGQLLAGRGFSSKKPLEGIGVAVLPLYFIDEDIREGRLQQLYPELTLHHDFFRLIWHAEQVQPQLLQTLAEELRTIALT